MRHQRHQFLAIVVHQRRQRAFVMARRAETEREFQHAVQHLPVERQFMPQRRIAVLRLAARFGSRRPQSLRLETAVELAQVIENQLRPRQGGQRGARRIVAQMAQQAVADAPGRHVAQILLDAPDGGPRLAQWRQTHRINAGVPAHRAAGVKVVEQVFTAMAFHLDQHLRPARVAAQGAAQRRQQQVVDLGAVGGRRLFQQPARGLAVQRQAQVARVARGIGAIRTGAGQGGRRPPYRQPVGQLGAHGRRVRVLAQAQRPRLQTAAARRQRRGGAGQGGPVRRFQIFQQHPPRDAVDGQMVYGEEQPRAAIGHMYQLRAQQPALLQVQAALRLAAGRLDGGAVLRFALPQQLGRHGAVTLAPGARIRLPEAQAQRLVMRGEHLQRAFQRARVERAVRPHQQRLVPVVALRDGGGKEIELDRQQRHLALRVFRHRRRGLQRLRHQRQGGDALAFEQLLRRQLPARLARARDNLQAEDGVAAQFKEVILAPHPFQAQHLAPQARQHGFHLALGRRMLRAGAKLRGRQRLAIELAVAIQGQARQRDKRRRHHVVGHAHDQRSAQRRRVQHCGRDIGHQAQTLAGRLRHHHRLGHAGLLQ
ncbi:hypothetical protein JANLI_04370 [Janthinobacterium lividum]|nr:hypothetical protein JANLI_04370 [Janthinobacterium lividum]